MEQEKDHKHKLTHVTKEATEILEKMTPEEEQKVRKELQESGLSVPEVQIKEIIELNKEQPHLHSQFQNLMGTVLLRWLEWNGFRLGVIL